MITVLLADDHALVRKGFRRLLEDEEDIRVVGEAGDGAQAVELAKTLRPDVVVMDYAMPGMDGLQATHEIRRNVPESAILMLSMHADENYVRNALDAGASGYILKNALDLDLSSAVRAVAAGRAFGLPRPRADQDEHFDRLTPREKQILQLIAKGHSNKEIAAMLGLSVNTVSVHRANVMNELNLHRTAELVLYAIRHGLVSPR
ncbi:MAG: response regulator transcription factor [Acidobacteria bacterium]|nr:response regulator transcription factor [Acidobacteriota bacterium]